MSANFEGLVRGWARRSSPLPASRKLNGHKFGPVRPSHLLRYGSSLFERRRNFRRRRRVVAGRRVRDAIVAPFALLISTWRVPPSFNAFNSETANPFAGLTERLAASHRLRSPDGAIRGRRQARGRTSSSYRPVVLRPENAAIDALDLLGRNRQLFSSAKYSMAIEALRRLGSPKAAAARPVQFWRRRPKSRPAGRAPVVLPGAPIGAEFVRFAVRLVRSALAVPPKQQFVVDSASIRPEMVRVSGGAAMSSVDGRLFARRFWSPNLTVPRLNVFNPVGVRLRRSVACWPPDARAIGDQWTGWVDRLGFSPSARTRRRTSVPLYLAPVKLPGTPPLRPLDWTTGGLRRETGLAAVGASADGDAIRLRRFRLLPRRRLVWRLAGAQVGDIDQLQAMRVEHIGCPFSSANSLAWRFRSAVARCMTELQLLLFQSCGSPAYLPSNSSRRGR